MIVWVNVVQIHLGLLFTVTDVSTTCAVVTFRVKVSCIMSVDTVCHIWNCIYQLVARGILAILPGGDSHIKVRGLLIGKIMWVRLKHKLTPKGDHTNTETSQPFWKFLYAWL